MGINKIGPNLWRIKVSIRVPGKDDPVKKQEKFTGSKIDAQLRESEIIRQIKDCAGSCSLKYNNVQNFKDILSIHRENLQTKGTLSHPHLKKIIFLEKELGHIPLQEFADRFEMYIKQFKATITMHGTVRSASSTNRIISLTRAAFNIAIDIGVLDKNPITRMRFPKGEESVRNRYLSQEERIRLLTAIRTYRPYLLPFVQYSLLVPCRKSELVKAEKSQYNQVTGTLYIPDSKAKIPINKPVPPWMKEYFRNIPEDCPFLFYKKTLTGKYRALGDFRMAWRFCLKKAGLSDVHIHDLRHISATDLYSAGIPEREIMDIAGWKTPMLSTYRHKDSLKTAQKINRFFEQSEISSPAVFTFN